jgi:hypothetical protein
MKSLTDIAKGSYNQVVVDLAKAIEDRLDCDCVSDVEIECKAVFTDFADELEDMKIKAKATFTDFDDRISKLEKSAIRVTPKKVNRS